MAFRRPAQPRAARCRCMHRTKQSPADLYHELSSAARVPVLADRAQREGTATHGRALSVIRDAFARALNTHVAMLTGDAVAAGRDAAAAAERTRTVWALLYPSLPPPMGWGWEMEWGMHAGGSRVNPRLAS
eukprot:gene7468-2359_t